MAARAGARRGGDVHLARDAPSSGRLNQPAAAPGRDHRILRPPAHLNVAASFRRLARRQGKPKAVVAVMHNVLAVIYCVLHERTPYAELGTDYFVRQDPQRAAHRHVAQLERLGYRVALLPATAA